MTFGTNHGIRRWLAHHGVPLLLSEKVSTFKMLPMVIMGSIFMCIAGLTVNWNKRWILETPVLYPWKWVFNKFSDADSSPTDYNIFHLSLMAVVCVYVHHFQIRFLHDPSKDTGYVGCALTSNMVRFYKNQDDSWSHEVWRERNSAPIVVLVQLLYWNNIFICHKCTLKNAD